MPKISDEILDILFDADEHVQKAGMAPLSAQELKRLYHEQANKRMGLAPTSASTQNKLPVAGFQGTPTFPNQGGGFSDSSGLAELSMGMNGPSQMPQQLGPMGQPQQNYQIPRRPNMTQMAQMNPQMGQQMGQQAPQGPRGFTTNIQIGEDGQVAGINLKRAMQKRMRNGQG